MSGKSRQSHSKKRSRLNTRQRVSREQYSKRHPVAQKAANRRIPKRQTSYEKLAANAVAKLQETPKTKPRTGFYLVIGLLFIALGLVFGYHPFMQYWQDHHRDTASAAAPAQD